MFVSDEQIAELIERYGRPKEARFRFGVNERGYGIIRGSQKDGRRHDITVYIRKGEHIVVNAKHFYPPGLFRAPSGGLKPGEDFHEGVYREIAEETGCEIAITRFLLRSEVTFFYLDEPESRLRPPIDWLTLVFEARYLSGDFDWTDHQEIRDVSLCTLDDFRRFGRMMRETDNGGLHYRAALHERVEPLLSTD